MAAVKVGMILAAGRGERMRPLTDAMPKPLIELNGKPLIEYQIERLKAAGCERVVINQGWLGEKLPQRLGRGERFGLQLQYSDETAFDEPLETAGGIVHALSIIDAEQFYVINGDVYCDCDLSLLELNAATQANLVLVNNPQHNVRGDFSVEGSSLLDIGGQGKTYTFAGEGLYSRSLFAGVAQGRQPLKPIFIAAMRQQKMAGTIHHGQWCDVGTPERLAELELQLDKAGA